MAGDWIKMEVCLPEKPEIWQIASMIGCDADSVVGKLLKVWRWFDAHTESGNAVGVSYALVDHVAGVSGFAEAMAMCGWLLQDGAVLILPNFDRHNGKTAKNRALTAKRVAKHGVKTNAETNGDSVSSALAREEKRREEIKTSPDKSGSGVELPTWLDSLDGADAIPATDPIFEYATKAGIPRDWLALSWERFVEDMTERHTRKKDWRAHYRNAVRKNWFRLWAVNRQGEYFLTTEGVQAQRALA